MPEFTVTEDHIRLLQAMYIGWNDCEYGAPAVDCKRPYGNSDVAGDIAETLGWDWPDEALSDRVRAIHQEMQTVLQILVRNLSIEPGTYTSEPYLENWSRA